MSALRRAAAAALLALVALPAAAGTLPVAVGGGEGLPTLAPMLERVTPAVVNIATRGRIRVQDNPLLQDPFFRRFFGLPDVPVERPTQSLGSGVIVDAGAGYVLTNHHVIAKADEITVTLRDGRSFEARLVGSDPETDIAVLQIPAENLVALPLADSDRLRVGDFVVAIGNPFGLGQTVTSGIVSALGRSGLGIEGYEDFIQTDASINPGNSGGALVDLRGELVGINTAILAPGGGNVGIGFAIPSNMAREVMEQLVRYGEVRRGRLGVVVQDLTPELARAFGLARGEGAVIAQVVPGSPAEKAGLQPGDVVVEINGRRVRNSADLRNAIGLLRVGERVRLEIVRDGRRRTVEAEIAEPEIARVDGGRIHPRLEGTVLSEIEPGSEAARQGLEGVVIAEVEPGSPAARAGLRPGDVIVSANRRRVTSLEALRQAVDPRRPLLMNLRRGEGGLFVLLQ
ncbi:serine protease Do/serine protease DegQ [Inmirania thermothiophila]|uniref:Serine protease Do/serine protease DegQ n=1 Tax=Inmirania thermothiophila TaxID=1750597 RepID=A0A3N1YAA5_9GAMM|nr:serine protease Do/serine protease DegQ [Inmirania thermothiophila]